MNSRIRFLNTYINNITMDETLDQINNMVSNGRYNYITPINTDCIVKMEDDIEIRKIINNADLILADGKPLIWISNILGDKIIEKVSGSDLFPLVCKMAASKGYKIFLLGAGEGVAQKAGENLLNKYNGLQIVGYYSPHCGFENDRDEIDKIIGIVNNCRPDILFAAFGFPKQEKFIYNYLNELKVPVSIAVGGSFDFIAGRVKRAPKWMQECGLEWFYRFLKEPRRMFKRYFVNDIKIIKIFFKYEGEHK